MITDSTYGSSQAFLTENQGLLASFQDLESE